MCRSLTSACVLSGGRLGTGGSAGPSIDATHAPVTVDGGGTAANPPVGRSASGVDSAGAVVSSRPRPPAGVAPAAKNPDGPALVFTELEWRCFLDDARKGEFDPGA